MKLTLKKRKKRVVKAKNTGKKRKLFGGANHRIVVFKFTIIGGLEHNEEEWVFSPPNQLNKEAKDKFKFGVRYALFDIIDSSYIDHLKYRFTENELVVTSAIDAVELDEVIDHIIDFVELSNDNYIWQTQFGGDKFNVESEGFFYKFSTIKLVPIGA